MYGYLRMVNQGWELAVTPDALKYGGEHGLDGLFRRRSPETGVLEFAALESKTAGGLNKLERHSGLRQGEQAYILDRIDNALKRNIWMSTGDREMLLSARARAKSWEGFSSYASIVDADRLISLPQYSKHYATQSKNVRWAKPGRSV